MPYDKEAIRRRNWAIKNALTYSEKALIDFYELQWMLRHTVPTVEEVTKHLQNKFIKEGKHATIKQTAINYYLTRAPVIKALEERGIPWRQHSQGDLTSTQIAVANVMMNFSDTRSNNEKLDQLGVNPTQYYAWLNDPQFKNLIDSLSDQNLKNIRPTAITEFTKLVQKGDWNAIKYYLDITGAAVNESTTPIEQMMIMVLEVLQKHIKDPAVMNAVADDLIRVSSSRHLEATPQNSITGEVVDDYELEDAKRKLGI